MRHSFGGIRVVLHNRTDGDDNGFWSPNAGTGEVWRMEVVEPSSDFVRRGISEKEAHLTFDMLPITINVQINRD